MAEDRTERMKRCETCAAWFPAKDGHGEMGECRLRAPVVVVVEKFIATEVPRRRFDWVCLEWLPKDAKGTPFFDAPGRVG